MASDLELILQKEWLAREWTDRLGIQSLVASTIVEIIAELSKVLAKFEPATLEVWKAQQAVTLATSQWASRDAESRARKAIEHAAETEFGRVLAGVAVLHDARLLVLIADNSRLAPAPDNGE